MLRLHNEMIAWKRKGDGGRRRGEGEKDAKEDAKGEKEDTADGMDEKVNGASVKEAFKSDKVDGKSKEESEACE